jgi:WD40 repeat protein
VERRPIPYASCALVMILFSVVPGVSSVPLPQVGLPKEPISAANLDRLVEIASLDYPGGEVWSVAFSPDGPLLATGSHDGAVRVWDVHRQELAIQFFGHDLDVYSVAFSPDGRLLASGGWDGSVRLWSVPTRKKWPTSGGTGSRCTAWLSVQTADCWRPAAATRTTPCGCGTCLRCCWSPCCTIITTG